ncbi:MAG TPA: wax ester/triacylglycerol synthase domain-containing protein, partial [Geodermatophilus sp.]|nr:wax ester/triacylglycerol synthase domain-containing protein [Geodermatophilus sp.]
VPLTAEDRAILALEDARLVGHTATVVHLPGGAPDLEQLRDAITRRLPAAQRLTWRLSGTPEGPVWRPDEVDVAAHVRAVGAACPLDGSGLRAELVRLFRERLDRSRPLWRIDVVGPVAGFMALPASAGWPPGARLGPRRRPGQLLVEAGLADDPVEDLPAG